MSERWMGLHNHEQHCEGFAYLLCKKCGWMRCSPDSYCRCCLAAEVEVLRAQVQRARRLGGAWETQAREFSAQGVALDLNRAYAARCLADALDGGDDVQ